MNSGSDVILMFGVFFGGGGGGLYLWIVAAWTFFPSLPVCAINDKKKPISLCGRIVPVIL